MKVFCLRFLTFQLMVIFVCVCLQAQKNETQAHAPLGLIGTWKLKVAKSTFKGVPRPASQILKWELDGDTLKFSFERVDQKGERTAREDWTAKYDGKDHLTGTGPIVGQVSVKRIDAYASELNFKPDGKDQVHLRQVASRDGKTLTVSRTTVLANGQHEVEVHVYDRQ
jgi:hypothetical protein